MSIVYDYSVTDTFTGILHRIFYGGSLHNYLVEKAQIINLRSRKKQKNSSVVKKMNFVLFFCIQKKVVSLQKFLKSILSKEIIYTN